MADEDDKITYKTVTGIDANGFAIAADKMVKVTKREPAGDVAEGDTTS